MTKKIFLLLIFMLSLVRVDLHAQENAVAQTTDTLTVIQHVEKWYRVNTNYWTITALMAAESSVLPVPSEMVIPPAVYVAMEPDSKLNIFLIILFGTIGALIGASFNYFMSAWLGRLVVYRFAESKIGKVFLLSSAKIQKAETFFNSHGKTSTFIGRLIPVVRHLISIPAGLARMNYPTFLFYTFLGAGLWNVILAALGYVAGENRELINKYSHELSYLFLIIGVVMVAWLVIKSRSKKK